MENVKDTEIIKAISNQYDSLRLELLMVLIPRILYTDGKKYRAGKLFKDLKKEGKNMLYGLYEELCEQDGMPCPYMADDFQVDFSKVCGVSMLKINVPLHDRECRNIAGAYILYARINRSVETRYFVIRLFENNQYILYIPPVGEGVLLDELTERANGIISEQWQVLNAFIKLICKDKKEMTDTLKWSKDWRNFDWYGVSAKLDKIQKEAVLNVDEQKDIGITKEELREYFAWLCINEPEEYEWVCACLKAIESENADNMTMPFA